MSKFIKCVNSVGQPRLEAGETYELLFDVTQATNGDGVSKSGYIIKDKNDEANYAVPYVYDRTRFVDAYTD